MTSVTGHSQLNGRVQQLVHVRSTTAWLWGGAVVLIALAYWPGLDLPGRGAREALLPACAVGLLALGLAVPRLRLNPWLPVLLGTALLAGAAGVVLAAGPDRMAVARDWIVLAAPWIACLAAASRFDHDGEDGLDDALERAAVLALSVIAAIGLLQAWTGWQGIEQGGPPASLFVNRDVAAQIVALLLPLVAVQLVRPGTGPWRWVALGAETAGLAFLIATRTRGAWLGLACGAAIAAVVLLRSRSPRTQARPVFSRLGAAVLLAALAALVPVRVTTARMPSVRATLATLADPTAGSGGVRLALWSNTLVLTGAQAWIGHGAGRFAVVYPLYQAARIPTPDFGTTYQPLHPHNDWLEYAAELGWPATSALAVAMLVGILLCLRRGGDLGTDERLRRAARAAVLGAALGHGLLSFPLHSPASALVAWIVVGRAWAGASRGATAPAGARRTLAAAGALLALVLLALGASELKTRATLGQAIRAQRAGDCDTALRLASRVVRSTRLRDARGFATMIAYECEPDQDAALVLLERALVVHPNNLNLLLAVGSRRMKAGRLEAAEQAYRAAVGLVPAQAGPWTGLAMAQALMNDRTAAAESCRTALRLEPDFAAARTFCEANELLRDAP